MPADMCCVELASTYALCLVKCGSQNRESLVEPSYLSICHLQVCKASPTSS